MKLTTHKKYFRHLTHPYSHNLSKFQQTNISKKIKECYSNQFYLISSKIFSDVEKVFINAAEIIYEDLQHIEEHHQQNNIISFEKPSVWNNIKIKVKTCF